MPSQEQKDRAYAAGVKAGQTDGLLDAFVENSVRGFHLDEGGRELDEIRAKGYEYGQQHRPRSSWSSDDKRTSSSDDSDDNNDSSSSDYSYSTSDSGSSSSSDDDEGFLVAAFKGLVGLILTVVIGVGAIVCALLLLELLIMGRIATL